MKKHVSQQDEDRLVPLRKYVQENPFSLDSFLRIAISLAERVLQFHKAMVIHKGIQSDRLFVSGTHQIVVEHVDTRTGLSNAGELVIPGTGVTDNLAYMAPEQLGRTGLAVDERTDIYSLGVVYYELATGRLPHEETEPGALIHAHMAKDPLFAQDLNPLLPGVVAEVIAKCLQKSPHKRYQSVYGLLSDLNNCYAQLSKVGMIGSFQLGGKDFKGLSIQPKVVIPRDAELKRLYLIYEQVRLGSNAVVYVTGESGIGKSVFVESWLEDVREPGMLIASAKCDLNHWRTPYGPLANALRGLVRRLLVQPEFQHDHLKNQVRTTLKNSISILLEVMPELESLVEQADSLSTHDVQDPLTALHRTQLAFRDLIEGLLIAGKPLIIFIDDVQWADPTTLQILEYLFSQRDLEQVMFIVTLRSDFLVRMTSWIQNFTRSREQQNVVEIPIEGLSKSDTESLICFTLGETPEFLETLTEYVEVHSQGNPFSVWQILSWLYDNNQLMFDANSGHWDWDLNQYKGLEPTNSKERISSLSLLSESRLRALQWAACIGTTFDLFALKILLEVDLQELQDAIKQGIGLGLIVPVHGVEHAEKYTFSHDQVQEACLSSLPQSQREYMHQRIGEMLLSRFNPEVNPDAIFDIVDHLNLSVWETERLEAMATYNAQAGERALRTAAFETGLDYFSTGLRLLGNQTRHPNESLMLRLLFGGAECSFMMGRVQESEQMYRDILDYSSDLSARVDAFRGIMRLYTHSLRNEDAFHLAAEALVLLGYRLPSTVTNYSIAIETFRVWLTLLGKSENVLAKSAEIQDCKIKMILDVLSETTASAFYIDQKLMMFIFLRMLKMSVKYGNSAAAALAYSNYGMLLCAGFHRYYEGAKFGRIGLSIAQRYNDQKVEANSKFIVSTFVNPWSAPFHEARTQLEEARDMALASGDVFTTCTSAMFATLFKFFEGSLLSEVSSSLEEHLKLVMRLQNPLSQDFLEFLGQVCSTLQATDLENESLERLKLDLPNDPTFVMAYGTVQLLSFTILNMRESAAEILTRIEKATTTQSFDFFLLPDILTLQALILADSYPAGGTQDRLVTLLKFKSIIKRLKRWTKTAPDNNFHKLFLVKAEFAQVLGRKRKAEKYYEMAVIEATKHGFLQYSAIANERSANYFLLAGKTTIARAFVTAAMDDYQRWGATIKVRQMEHENSTLLRHGHGERRRMSRSRLNQMSSLPRQLTERVDLMAVVRGAQIISREVILGSLLKKLMTVMLENAGADLGSIFLQRDGEIYLEAHASVHSPDPSILQSVTLEESGVQLPVGIVKYTFLTQNDVLLDQAVTEGDFRQDPYVLNKKLQSVLCTPIVSRNHVIGVLYLENNQIPKAFTAERLQVLRLLATQAAISIENAYLYSNLEQKVIERTNELENSKRALEEMNVTLRHANEQLTKSEQIRRELIANVSHDLRTPVTLILGYSDAILNAVTEDEQQVRTFLEKINLKAQGLTRLIEDLFELARLESGKMRLSLQTYSVNEIFNRVVENYGTDVEQAGLKFEARESTTSEDMIFIRADLERLDQVFSNLIYNAIKFTPKGGQIKFAMSEDLESVTFDVVDTGLGIDAEALPHIFERFYKADKSRNAQQGGSGLGLAIAKEIVEIHGGEISASSQLGTGSSFTIRLPIFK